MSQGLILWLSINMPVMALGTIGLSPKVREGYERGGFLFSIICDHNMKDPLSDHNMKDPQGFPWWKDPPSRN